MSILLSENITPPSTPIKLVFFDVDGTLLNADGHYSENLVQQLKRIQAKGIKTAIASGRPYFAAQFLFDELNIIDAGLFCTGAMVYEPSSGRKIQSHHLDEDSVISLCERARQQGLYCEVYTEDDYFIETQCHVSRIHNAHLRCESKVEGFESLFKQHPRVAFSKLLLGVDQRRQPDALSQLAQAYPHLQFAFAGFLPLPGWLFASVIDKQADKAIAFEELLHYHGVVPEEVMSLGDSHSDMTFLSKAGVGVAMGNANDAVKACANYTTRAADCDGVAFALQQLIP